MSINRLSDRRKRLLAVAYTEASFGPHWMCDLARRYAEHLETKQTIDYIFDGQWRDWQYRCQRDDEIEHCYAIWWCLTSQESKNMHSHIVYLCGKRLESIKLHIDKCFPNYRFVMGLQPHWCTETVHNLASIYAHPGILADAMIDGGCVNEDYLAHLRGQAKHWQGCYVYDLINGKS